MNDLHKEISRPGGGVGGVGGPPQLFYTQPNIRYDTTKTMVCVKSF